MFYFHFTNHLTNVTSNVSFISIFYFCPPTTQHNSLANKKHHFSKRKKIIFDLTHILFVQKKTSFFYFCKNITERSENTSKENPIDKLLFLIKKTQHKTVKVFHHNLISYAWFQVIVIVIIGRENLSFKGDLQSFVSVFDGLGCVSKGKKSHFIDLKCSKIVEFITYSNQFLSII